ncbi:tRNA (adenosine(37)-N6)-threonylcarbamoyltransferase complex transferase subunit TsaD [Candidatus Parcubacteria bacterium]|nr:tRNA (adenosine(37)-N6)-threonylcarbamoyltransferase complex transferase subunit TsaD [Candidatus Parcubacteria bacterium]
MKILGIETSCDETAAAVVAGNGERARVLSNIVSSQIEIHKKYGGVVPEVAAREHVLNILPVINEALETAGLNKKIEKKKQRPKNNDGIATLRSAPLAMTDIDAIAVTVGPGLITSLITGIETAKSLAYAWNIPLIGVNHIEGHIYANFIESRNTQHTTCNMQRITCNTQHATYNKKFEFPAIILTVSGGHTMLVLMNGHGRFKTIGETRDDAAGEAFDKAAKMMGIGYPGGPVISAEAEKFLISKLHPSSEYKQIINKSKIINHKSKISLPRPMIDSPDFDFSFSGLKTAIRYALEEDKNWKDRIPEYCAEFQQAIIDVLIKKTIKAGNKFNVKTIMLAGGVSANKELRKQLEKQVLKNNFKFSLPDLKYTTDNAAMIATAGYFKALRKEFTPWQDLRVDCNLEF